MGKKPPDESNVSRTHLYADRIRGVYVEKRHQIATRVDKLRAEISDKIRQRLKELNEQMTKFSEWLATVKREKLSPEQQENLRRIIDFQCTRVRKRLDSLYRWNEEAKKIPKDDGDPEKKNE